MKVILQQDIHDLGLEGDTVEVADGYARNYLIPKGLALEATSQNLKMMEQRRKKIEAKRVKAQGEAEAVKEKIESLVLMFRQKAGEEGKLYGSVTAMDIAESLEQKGIVVDRRKIVLDQPIKSLGDFDVGVKLYPGVVASLKVTVAPEE